MQPKSWEEPEYILHPRSYVKDWKQHRFCIFARHYITYQTIVAPGAVFDCSFDPTPVEMISIHLALSTAGNILISYIKT